MYSYNFCIESDQSIKYNTTMQLPTGTGGGGGGGGGGGEGEGAT